MTNEQQKKLGAFYTPESVTDCLSFWAIRHRNDLILEPSFGGCNFLTSSIQVLSQLGARQPYRHIFGFDIDTAAFEILKSKKLDSTNFIFEDFLKFDDTGIVKPLDVVLGNPPYVPVHKLEKNYKNQLFKKFKTHDIKIAKRSGLWIYFVVHSLKYLKRGGRMAWVLPDSLAFTDYGKLFISQISKLFTTVKIVRIEERYFADAGTKEKTSFLLCEEFKQGTCEPQFVHFKFLEEALRYVSGVTNVSTYLSSQSSEKELKNGSQFKLSNIGEIFDVRIGIVIGATDRLVYNQERGEKSPYFPDFLYPVITKGKQLNGITVNKELLKRHTHQMPYLLVDGIKLQSDNLPLFEQLVTSIPESVLLNQTFRKRTVLFGYDDFKHPDAFLTFFSQGLPKLVINEGKQLNSTNSVHRLYLKQPLDNNILKFIAIQLFAGYFSDQIHSLARPYGNSIKKFEPSDAKKIPLLVPLEVDENLVTGIQAIMSLIANNVEIGNVAAARKIAFNWLTQLLSL